MYLGHEIPASLIPLDVILPDQNVYDYLKQRMEVIVERIICKHVTYFKENVKPVKHIKHRYSEQSKIKSKLVSNQYFIVCM